MKGFFKTFLAVLLALIVVSLLPVVIIFAVAGSLEPATPAIENGSVLVINLDENITDSPRTPTFEFGGSTLEMTSSLTILEVQNALEAAATDERIASVLIHLNGAGAIEGTAHIEEFRGLIADFKATSGKKVVAYNEVYSQGSYWLASVADEVYLNPAGSFDWRGLASQSIFFKGAIDKLGLDVQIMRHGTFKSAVEPYMLTRMSEANRLQSEAMVGSLWQTLIDDVALSRNLSPFYLNQHATLLSVSSPKKAVELGFVDGLKYEDEIWTMLGDSDKAVTLGEYCAQLLPTKISPNKVAIIYADGEIVDGEAGEGIVGGATLAEQIARAREDAAVKAVVLRVNSPGGSALASEVMWRELKLLEAEKPVVVSMSGYAASGGYYISSPADHIVAARTTLTGSIGVFGVMISAGNTLKDKLGITTDVAKTSPHADMGTMFRPLSFEEQSFMQKSVEEVYGVFVDHVAEGREMTHEAVDAIGQGRVWSGEDAKEIGLVDEFGGLKLALQRAAELAELGDDWRVVEILPEEDEFTALLKSLSRVGAQSRTKGEMGLLVEEMESLGRILEGGSSVQARIPYFIRIY